MSDLIDFAYYQTLTDDYSAAKSLVTQAIDYLEQAVDVVVMLDEVIPEVDLLSDFYSSYLNALNILGANSVFSQAVRSLQSHVLNRGGYANIDAYMLAEAGAWQVYQEWADLSQSCGYVYAPAYIDGNSPA
jgi:hypothetical protein